MGETPEIWRKRLAFRSRRRGTKEMDLLVGAFAERHLAELDVAQLERFEALLDLPEPLLYAWLIGRGLPDAAHDNDVLQLLMNFKNKQLTN